MMTCSKIRLGPGARTRTAPVFPLEQFGALTLDLLYVDQQVVRTCPFFVLPLVRLSTFFSNKRHNDERLSFGRRFYHSRYPQELDYIQRV